MQRTAQKPTIQLAVGWRHTLSFATQSALAILCGLVLTSGTLAQEQRPEPPEPSTPEASSTPKAPDPNETVTPSPQANQTVDGDIVFTSPGQFTYPRDIRLSDNFGGLRFFGADSLTTSPAGAAIQFFGNNASPFNGQLYLDSGALNTAALIFRTAPTGGTITERMRIAANGNIGIGGVMNPLRAVQIGESPDAAFTIEPSVGSPNAGVIRFGDNTGWQLLIGRSREFSGGPLNTGIANTFLTIKDAGEVVVDGRLSFIPINGGISSVCRTGGIPGTLAFCSSSLRYKTAVQPFAAGLELVRRLRPISFTWKSDGTRDLGLAAEEVAQVEPRLVTHNPKGEVEGVKYDHLNVVLLNAIKEQQAQIESLKRIVCLDHPAAEICQAGGKSVGNTLRRAGAGGAEGGANKIRSVGPDGALARWQSLPGRTFRARSASPAWPASATPYISRGRSSANSHGSARRPPT